MLKYFCFLIIIFNYDQCFGWNGYDYESGEFIEIQKENLVRPGLEIEVFHWETCEYRDEEVIDVSDSEVETYDYDECEYHTYEMN